MPTNAAPGGALSPWLTLLLASSCGLIAANLYYAQPLVGPISADLGMPPAAAGLIVTLTQVGYGTGLLLIVPLGDLVETRRLVLAVIALGATALIGASLATAPTALLTAALFIGLGSVAVQILVPYAAHLAPEAGRGRVVGNVMSGLMFGIMLARPVSSFVASLSSWHVVFVLSAAVMAVLAAVLYRALPRREPTVQLTYGQLLASMGRLALTQRVLQRRALYQAGMFGAFSLFWTAAPLLLASPIYGLGQRGIALFAFAGVAGAIAAPVAGRVADRGWTRGASFAAMLAAALSFLTTLIAAPGSMPALGLLVAAGILLDFGVTANVVLGQRAIYALGDAFRSRLNGLYMATFFAGGAVGSALGGWSFAHGGWTLTAWVGFALPAAALLFFLTERR